MFGWRKKRPPALRSGDLRAVVYNTGYGAYQAEIEVCVSDGEPFGSYAGQGLGWRKIPGSRLPLAQNTARAAERLIVVLLERERSKRTTAAQAAAIRQSTRKVVS